MSKIYHIEPIYKSFIWAGRTLIDRFGLETDLENVGTIYCAIALPGELDNIVEETGQPLSEFYAAHRELFGCDEEHFPVRMTVTCNEGFQSYQSHPDDAYALAHDGAPGKVSGAVTLRESDHVSTQLFGHKAASREEFRRLIEQRDWDALFSTIEVRDGDFLHTPAGVIHGGQGAGAVAATFGTNGDLTYRFYDMDRNDPDRPLRIDDVCNCASFPELPLGVDRVAPVREGDALVYAYHDVDGEYVALRYKVDGSATVAYDGFVMLCCVEGSGTVDGVLLELGRTLLVPNGYGPFELMGTMDVIGISYHSARGGAA